MAKPNIFALPPGVDFARELLDGLRARIDGPPEAMAEVELYVNTERMARRLRSLFDQGPATLLPRIRLVTDLADPLTRAQLPQPVPPLRRRLEMVGLVARLIEAQPDLAPRSALYDLADSLVGLMEEMHSEDVPPEKVAQLDISDQSGHWARALTFFNAVQPFFDEGAEPDRQSHARLALEQRLNRWEIAPPQHPIIVAGSTGSRGTTAAFMRAVARLPRGAVVLPGFDFDMPDTVWDRLGDPMKGEDHPQFRFARLLAELGLTKDDVARWTGALPPSPARGQLLSLALRPAPVTHQWMSEGPNLPDLRQACADVTLLEAPTTRDEAMAIALRLRDAAETGTRAALITPDRMLTRQVTSALDRWGITPDDSAGIPAQLTPPGRFLRHVAELFTKDLSAEALLTLLKHPLTHSGAERGPHLIHTRDLELHIRKKGLPFPGAEAVQAWAQAHDCPQWGAWVAETFCDQREAGEPALADWIDRHVALAERIAAGAATDGSGGLWQENAGRKLQEIVSGLAAEAEHGSPLDARDYADLFGAILAAEEVRNRDEGHPHILIWGTLEARVMDADLLILAGLNEGSWPEMPGADPWLNRKMRADVGLLLPERRIGLSAHDFQQAAAAPEVWFTRALKSDDAETVPSRWLNRTVNLMTGLSDRHGPEALATMKAKGAHWLALARASEQPLTTAPARRPSPAPPAEARPRELPVTDIKKLVRDPYAIYVRRILRLRALDPLMRAPDALMRGVLVHSVLENFVKATQDDPANLTVETLMQKTAELVGDAEQVPFPTIRALWTERMRAISGWFVATEAERQALAHPAHFEVRGKAVIPALGFTLTGQADRIDIDDRGGAHIYDYKTGSAPTGPQQKQFDKQLLLEAAMVEKGAFKDLAPRHVERALFIALKPGDLKEVPAPLDESPPDKVWEELALLIAAYLDPAKGFSARRALMSDSDFAEFDHLSRLGEWDVTDPADPEVLT
ncbi:double-strand break repair protein AddB [Tropicibacter oceani]|uniref:Double-strand break repair protein AddB n=1 Tax=Tropicibacter oceani TaxID=3058420 RepID=A0ABY8QIW3_9RHOB|nr:double-strand break repair protein AddB [Tropicibacter oceani]WGW04560.1 double-strand break repair protein AddB [Tropicibacter oceani]